MLRFYIHDYIPVLANYNKAIDNTIYMANLFFPSHQIQIYRQRRLSNSNRYAMSATFTAYEADIQPAGRERTEMVSGRFGKVWTAYIEPDIDCKEGDQLAVTDSNGITQRYSVRGVSTWTGAGLLDHKELIIVSQD